MASTLLFMLVAPSSLILLVALLPNDPMTKIADIMTRSLATVGRDETLQAAAQRMKEMDVGSLPVLDGKAVAGMVTDRDITIRGVAAGMIPQEALVADVMTEEGPLLPRRRQRRAGRWPRWATCRCAGCPSSTPTNESSASLPSADIATRQSAHTDETLREISTPGR
jgi:hypothetical protein